MEFEPLTKQEKYTLDLKEIAKAIKQQLKTEFPKCVFSVSIQRYSGGQSLHLSLMQSDFKVIQDFDKIPEIAILRQVNHSNYTIEQLKEMQTQNNHQLNQYGFTDRDTYNPEIWNNGVYLTEQGFNLFKRVVQLVNHYNYDDSDSSVDYFDTNFYFHPNIGKWDKPYKTVV